MYDCMFLFKYDFIFLLAVSSQDNVPAHGTYHVQYVDSEIYTATGQGQTQM
jgi:hypothetical protein